MSDRLVIDVDRDGWTKELQLNIAQLDEKDSGHGYRLKGPKYNGSSKNLLRCELDERDAVEIRKFLDAVFPVPYSPSRAEVLREAADALKAEFPHPEQQPGLLAAVEVLRRLADESGQEKATPDFFQPGHTYTDGNGYRAPELITYFRVEHVTRHPDRGHRRAIGWSRTGADAGWHGDFRDEGEFGEWSEVKGGAFDA